MCVITTAVSRDRLQEFLFCFFFKTIKEVDLGRVPTRTNYLINQSSAFGRRLGVIKYCLELDDRELKKKKWGHLLFTSNKKKKNRLPSPTFVFFCLNVMLSKL